MNLTNQQYNLLTNLEEEGVYGEETIPYIRDGFNVTPEDARQIVLQYMKLPKLNRSGQVTMDRYREITSFDVIVGVIALIGIVWALTYVL